MYATEAGTVAGIADEASLLRTDEESGDASEPALVGVRRTSAAGALRTLVVGGAIVAGVWLVSRCRHAGQVDVPDAGVAQQAYLGLVAKNQSVNRSCAKDYSEDCRDTPCCNSFTTCFEKNEKVAAACKPTCALGAPDEAPPWDPDADLEPWSCKVLREPAGKLSWTPPGDESPSLYCFLITLVMGNEPELLRHQLVMGSSVFGCNEYNIFSERKMIVGQGPAGQVFTTAIGGPMSTVQKNTPEFLRAWRKMRELGSWSQQDYVVKVDPDTVFIPSILRKKLAGHNQSPQWDPHYFKNCHAPTYTSVQGPLEIYSRAAAQTFLESLEKCEGVEHNMGHGEDWFFGHCLDMLGIRHIDDFSLLDDNYCGSKEGTQSCDGGAAAYHPFKTVEGYTTCYMVNV